MQFSFTDLALIGIVIAPLLGFLANGLFGRRFSHTLVNLFGCGSVFISFLLSTSLLLTHHHGSHTLNLFDWLPLGQYTAGFSLLADPLSIVMLLVVTGVGFLIHVYSAGYMHDDPGYSRFFAYLNLFVFSMLLLVLGANFPLMFAGWEGVGLCSFLLIGFWYKNADYNAAAKKAFVMNRIGDLGFLLAMFLIFGTFGSLDYADVFTGAAGFASSDATIVAITLLLFLGATGKSAQIPLYTWLPDAMAGPTPVSALIHAATMVTAGVYMIARCNVLFSLAPITLHVIAIVGIATALLAATIAMFQNDIKKVLAYSTVSQLGYMFIAMGFGAYTAGVFHLVTHAFFKALLFLGAGAVIHALHGEQDIRRMGGLQTQIPSTYKIFLIGTIAIAGLPPFAGFFSKDEILLNVFLHNPIFWFFGIVGSLLTATYMFRLLMMTFWGDFRGDKHTLEHLHHNPASMNIPLFILAGLSIVGGFIGLPAFLGGSWLHHFLEPVFEPSAGLTGHHTHASVGTEIALMATTVGAVLLTLYLYITKFKKQTLAQLTEEPTTSTALYKRLPANKYYVDEIYDTVFVRPLNALSGFAHRVLDIQFLDGIVNGIGEVSLALGQAARWLQPGAIGFYLFAMVFGAIAVIVFGLLW